MQETKFVTHQFGNVSFNVPKFSGQDVKDLRALVGKADGLGKPLSQFAFAVRFQIPIYSVQAWEAKKRNPSVKASMALELIKQEALTKMNQSQQNSLPPTEAPKVFHT